jgi:formate hydrogenlyase subunit 3/multisubunit Na+/H+ antiporter MnhD subunit
MPAMTLEIPWLLFGLRFGLDDTTGVFLVFTLLLWAFAALYAHGYVHERRGAFFAFFAATFAGNLGLVFARDAAGFYSFFALMTFAAYGLIVHQRDAAALRAGRIYIILALIGEAFLLAGLILAAAAAGNMDLAAIREGIGQAQRRELIVGLLFAGFGVKAGALGLHMWLPLAHPVAPTPASAVLSGAMIKAGLLGWLQFLPLGEVALPAWGAGVAALGLAGAFSAALAGVAQDDPKTVLAYSSVSQMGFMMVALGAGLAEPAVAPGAAAAAAFYALHHGLAKGALFLGVGIAPRHPWLLLALALPALGLAGMPFTSGAAAKHALKEVLGDWPTAATLLSFAAIGTTLLMARFLFLMKIHAHGHTSRVALLAWLAAVAASLAAAGFATMPGLSFADVWPVLAGVGIAAVVALFGGRLRTLRLPAGDLIVPLEILARRLLQGIERLAAAVGAAFIGGFTAVAGAAQRLMSTCSTSSIAGERRLRTAGPAAALIVIALMLASAW